PDLRQRWSLAIPELGHTTVAADIDGDGRDELYVGTRLIDADGRQRWSRPELLDGTGETHPDSNPIADLDGGGPSLLFGPGARILDRDGRVRRDFAAAGFREVQSVRVLRTARGTCLAFTDLPETGGPLAWRGMPIRNVRSVTTIVDPSGAIVARIPGMHTPSVADFDGDGEDELIYLDEAGSALRVLRADGSLHAAIPVQPRVYISDLAVGPLRADARGDDLVLHEWSDDFATATVRILSDPDARGRLRPLGVFELARRTPY
ncbi:MAG: hypothetical protein H0X45_12320, partial [Planctomycetes bacterium]|nr:hypothetical protein [Planctomycetota bacterium]